MKRSDVNYEELSPMMKQYMDTKEYEEELLFYRIGDFYELFFEDGITASRELELTLTGKNAGLKERVPMCGVPFHSVKPYIEKLIDEIGDYHIPHQWCETYREWKEKLYRVPPVKEGYVEPRSLIAKLSFMMKSKGILVADVGQNQIWCANNFRIREGRFLTTGGMGTMGYSVPAAIGAKMARPSRDVVAVCGDGSFQMNLTELGTIMQNNVDIKIIVMRNNRLGMVRELQSNHYGSRYSATILGDPDFTKIAEAYGIKTAEVNSNEEAEKVAEEMFKVKEPFILICNVHPDTPSI